MAIDMYQIDNQSYPWTDANPYGAQPIERRWIAMTTPIAYVAQIPVDPFGDPPGAEIERGKGKCLLDLRFLVRETRFCPLGRLARPAHRTHRK